MEHSIEEDPSNPGKFRVKFDLPNGGQILFTQLEGEVPSQDEFEAWTLADRAQCVLQTLARAIDAGLHRLRADVEKLRALLLRTAFDGK
jgi:hypothetical protein